MKRAPQSIWVCFSVAVVAAVGTVVYLDFVAEKVYPPPPPPPPTRIRIFNEETLAAYAMLGGAEGSWIASDGRLVWGRYSGGFVAGFAFTVFPRSPMPNAEEEFGLYLADCDVGTEDLRKLGHLKNLRLLELNKSQVSGSRLGVLREIGLLHTIAEARAGWNQYPRPDTSDDVIWLDLGETPVSDVALAELADFKNVTTVLVGPNVTERGLQQLVSQFKKLSHLNLRSARLTPAFVQQLAQLHPSISFEIPGESVTDEVFRSLRYARLLDYVLNKGTGPINLDRPDEITSIGLWTTNLSDDGLRELAPLTRLRHLSLGRRMTGLGLKHLADLKELDHVEFATSATDEGMKGLLHLPNVREVTIRSAHVTDSGLAMLASLRGLEKLTLRYTNVSEEGLQHLVAVPTLKSVSIDFRVTEKGIKTLSRLAGLEHLEVGFAEVSNSGLLRLATLRKLKSLSISKTTASPEAIDELGAILPNCSIDRAYMRFVP